MPSFNKVIIEGHLGADPETRNVGSTSLASMRVAIDDSYTSKGGEKVKKTVWVDVEAWDKQGEVCQKFLAKGSTVLIEGKLQMDEWEDKESGKKRTKLKIRAERVVFQDGKKSGETQDAAPGSPSVSSAVDKDGDEIPF